MEKKNNITSKQVVETAVVFAEAAVIAGLILKRETFYIVAAVLLGLLLISPILFRPLAIAWFSISRGMGRIMTTVLLCIVFFLVVMPVGVIRRMAGADPLFLRSFKRKPGTTFISRHHIFKSDDLSHPF